MSAILTGYTEGRLICRHPYTGATESERATETAAVMNDFPLCDLWKHHGTENWTIRTTPKGANGGVITGLCKCGSAKISRDGGATSACEICA